MENKRYSMKEAWRLTMRGIRVMYENAPQMMISRVIMAAWRSLTPYVGIFLSALIIDELTGERDPERLLLLVLTTLISAALISLVTSLLSRWTSITGANPYFRDHKPYLRKFLDMDYIDVEKNETRALFRRIQSGENGGGWGLGRTVHLMQTLLRSVLTILGGIAMTVTLFMSRVPENSSLSWLDHPLTSVLVILLMLAVTLLGPALSNLANSFFQKHFDKVAQGNSLFSHYSEFSLSKEPGPEARIYASERFATSQFSDKQDVFGSRGFFAKLSRGPLGLLDMLGSAVSVLFTGLAYGFVCLKALAGAFGVGAVTQYVSAITKVSDGVSSLVGELGNIKNNAPFLEQVFEFLDMPNNMYMGSLTVEKRRDRDYEIEFRNVSFRYPGAKTYALKHVNIKFRVGERLAVVGMNGSGKTTFIKLLCRLYDPTEGEILLNGINIQKYDYRDYMSVFSVVFQDFELFDLKLGENIGGCIDYDRARVLDALDKAGFTERLAELPDGLDTHLYKDYHTKSFSPSGGEAQKLAIARALYKDAPFIILDEPTAALDPLAEAEIYGKFNEIAGDRTAIYISHRLSSCRFCDEIAVFHEGTVVQKGTHDSLLTDKNGKYHELWFSQAQYYNEKAS